MTDDQRTKRDRLMGELTTPSWEAIESETGCQISVVLHVLYADVRRITELDMLVQDPSEPAPSGEWSLECFQRADTDALLLHRPLPDPIATFCFALAYRGDPYGVTLSESGDDGPVFRYSFDGGERLVAPSLATFIAWPRKRRPAGYEPPAGYRSLLPSSEHW